MSITWDVFATCRREDPDLFFPATYGTAHAGQITAAKAVCGRCPVRRTCLAEALTAEAGKDGPSRHGIVGGHTPRERARLDADRTAVAA